MQATPARITVQDSTYGIPLNHLADIAGVSLRTAYRWKRRDKVSRPFAALVDLKRNGHLGALHADWNGFTLVNGRLWTPTGEYVQPGHIYALVLNAQRVTAQQREIESLLEDLKRARSS